ncbi:MAG: tyrosine-type recombinase/integrase [Thermoleophilaceae bacterium]
MNVRNLAGGGQAVDVRIRRRTVTVGYSPEWDRARAKRLLEDRLVPMAKLGQPWWDVIRPPTPVGRSGSDVPDFHEAATEFLNAVEGRLENANSVNAIKSPVVKHLAPFFAYEDEERQRPRSLHQIKLPLVSEFVVLKRREREILRNLPDEIAELDDETLRDPDALAQQLDEEEWALLQRYGQRSKDKVDEKGRPIRRGKYSLSSRGLSNNEINRCLTQLASIIAQANETHGLDLRDPTRRARVPADEPPRSVLWPDQFEAVLDAARQLDERQTREEYAGAGRYDAIVVLGLAGPRVTEFGDARYRDLRRGDLHIPHAKTSEGRRDIHLHRLVRETLYARQERLGGRKTDYIFATASGTRRDRNNIRNRLLAPVLARAAELLDERGHDPLPPHVTPHTFRRTYLTYLAWTGRPERFAMAQAGHKDAKVTLEVYQQRFPSAKPDRRVVQWLRGD